MIRTVAETTKEAPEPIHSLTKLARTAGLPASFHSFLRELSPQYYLSRYPDATGDVPHRQYTQEDAEKMLQRTEVIMAWLDARMSKR